MNLYAYVGNNPIRFVDPFGLKGAVLANTGSGDNDLTKDSVDYHNTDPQVAGAGISAIGTGLETASEIDGGLKGDQIFKYGGKATGALGSLLAEGAETLDDIEAGVPAGEAILNNTTEAAIQVGGGATVTGVLLTAGGAACAASVLCGVGVGTAGILSAIALGEIEVDLEAMTDDAIREVEACMPSGCID